MIFTYEFKSKLDDFGLFLQRLCEKVKINYKLNYDALVFTLELDAKEEKILEFNEEVKKLPYFMFLEDFSFNQNKVIENNYKAKNILSLNLCDEIFLDLKLKKQIFKECKKSNFCIVANYELFKKAFICDKNTQILLNSYEKPFVKLALKSLYQKAHNLDDYLYVCFAPSKELSEKLKNANELYFVEDSKDFLIISTFDDDFCIINNPYCDEKIKAYNIDNFIFNVPSTLADFKKMLYTLENGEKLLNNYEKEFKLKEFKQENKLNLLEFINFIFDFFELDIKSIPNKYTKGLRIDFIDDINSQLLLAKTFSSIMSFKLAGAKMIEIGVFESLIAYLGKKIPKGVIYSTMCENASFLSYNAFLNKHLKLSRWQNYECIN
ncbi:hypothetical protein [Campylobacter canadensis]|uniref:Uncharacterized protein n=1 Tax=Campylobacter canadensis TaxID=449520 RepID=A0ABS7WQ29_9BACT|nr:hypothetical protein [Campylobacter canadensis]MBZ7986867.1 hypothetical protein [Campylobacter canadensis]MBZ7997904.1 hypothetical protein [Campylobacter canadensis]